jgi:hypothetical protein
MMKKSDAREWWYVNLTIFLPVTIVVLIFVTGMLTSSAQFRCDAVWEVANQIGKWVPYILVPVAFNIVFGPSILAFWYQKTSRVLILIANLIAVAVIWRTLDDIDNGLKWWAALPILWGWAAWGRAREISDSKSGVYLVLIAHICVIAFVYEHRKSPEQAVAEQILDHKTLKWMHDGKMEYFKTDIIDDDYALGDYSVGPAPTNVFDRDSQVNFEVPRRSLHVRYDHKGLKIFINLGQKDEIREFLSYETIFKSREVAVIN